MVGGLSDCPPLLKTKKRCFKVCVSRRVWFFGIARLFKLKSHDKNTYILSFIFRTCVANNSVQ